MMIAEKRIPQKVVFLQQKKVNILIALITQLYITAPKNIKTLPHSVPNPEYIWGYHLFMLL